MNSVPWLIAICLSPRTRRCPLGITCITVTEMVPVNELFAWEPPAPMKSWVVEASTLAGTIRDEREGAQLTLEINFEEVPIKKDGSFTYTYVPAADETSVLLAYSDGINFFADAVPIAGRVPDMESQWHPPFVTNIDCSGPLGLLRVG